MATYQEIGAEFTVTDGAGFRQGLSIVVGLSGGGFAVIWARNDNDRQSYDGDLRAQLYDGGGTRIGAPFTVVENTAASAFLPLQFSASALPNGGFVVVNNDYRLTPADDLSTAIAIHVFTAAGTRVGETGFVVSEHGRPQIEPEVTMLGGDRFAVAWDDQNAFDIKARIFDLQGSPLTGEIVVEDGIVATDFGSIVFGTEAPSIAALGNGGFVAAWTDFRQTDGDDSVQGIRARLFGADGEPLGPEFLVNTAVEEGQRTPRVSSLSSGGFVAVWGDSSAGGAEARLKAQVFDASGNRVGSELLVSETIVTSDFRNVYDFALTSLSSGDWVVAWKGDADETIRMQVFDANGARSGEELIVSDGAITLNRGFPSIASLENGGFVMTWDDQAANGPIRYGVRAQIFAPVAGQTFTGTAGNDVLTGLGGDDLIQGLAGDDSLSGEGGNDFLAGSSGADVLFGGAGADILSGGGGVDFSDGGAGNDFHYVDSTSDVVVERVGEGTGDRVLSSVSYVLSASAEVEVLSTDHLVGTAAINLFGNGFGNTIYGNAGANYVSGGAGADQIAGNGGDDLLIGGAGVDISDGGAGNDFHYVDSGADVVIERSGQGTADRVLTSVDFVLATTAEVEILSTDNLAGTAAINLFGNGIANSIYGNAGANYLSGGGGNDLLIGNAGNDILISGTGIDTTDGGTGDDFHYIDSASDNVIERAGEGTGDRILSSVSYILSASAEVEILSTDNLVGTAAIDLFGSSFGNIIYGNAGANYLSGGGGNDQISGNGGADILIGGVGADRSDGGAGNDFHYVDQASDTVVERVGEGTGDRVLAGVSYVLLAEAEVEILSTDNLAGTAAIDLTGNELAGTIYGNAGANIVNGGGGKDSLHGFGGVDTFLFDAALNTAFGGDFAALPASANVDLLADFGGGDIIALDNSVFTGLAAGGLAAGAFAIGTSAADADDRILYDPGSGALIFDADGSGGAAAQMFAILAPGAELGSGAFQVI